MAISVLMNKLVCRFKKRNSVTRTTAELNVDTPTTLPTELILYIFTLAASSPSSGQSSLASIALLCTSVQPWTQERLYSHPLIHSSGQLSKLRKTLKKNRRLAALVEELRLDGSAPTSDTWRNVTWSLPVFMKVAISVQRLEIHNATVFSLLDFANAEHVQHLLLTNSTISDRTSTLYQLHQNPAMRIGALTSLISLTLHGVDFLPSTATTFFSHTVTPSLRRLEMDGHITLEGPKRSMCELTSIEILAGLEKLVLGAPAPEEGEDNLRSRREAVPRMLVRATNLKSLEIATELAEPGVLRTTLPESLERLAITSVVRQPTEEEEYAARAERVGKWEMRKLLESCEARGVRVEVE